MTKQIDLQATVTPELAGFRLDLALSQLFPTYSRSRLQEWVKQQKITVNGQYLRSRDKLKGGEIILIKTELVEETSWITAEDICLNIIYQDEHVLLLNKPIGLVVHPGAGNKAGTLVNALLHFDPDLALLPRAGIVHRLDKDTSGIMVVARNLAAHTDLVRQLQERTIKRDYIAVVQGLMTAGGTVDEPIDRHPQQRLRMAVREDGKPAVTHYRVAERFKAHTMINVQLETGRTHQIRVHMAHIRHPVVGDQLYGGRFSLPPQASEELIATLRNFKHQALHAKRLQFRHPASSEEVAWEAPIPEDLTNLIISLRST